MIRFPRQMKVHFLLLNRTQHVLTVAPQGSIFLVCSTSAPVRYHVLRLLVILASNRGTLM
ncbi:hypothetical protein CVT25_002245 [Psilocybe cyanescens]|uniref:Uncharacterized protein n=1 Tax=Psilocybe cyanescens TaxID=93625 RepID=A0A409X5T7_PSICY|nr:hypothetical protein CVT25_002245 [Psilocybe cyanescens]